jgi:hypothetical protein
MRKSALVATLGLAFGAGLIVSAGVRAEEQLVAVG